MEFYDIRFLRIYTLVMHALSPRLYVPLLSTPFPSLPPCPSFPTYAYPTHVPDARDLVPGMDDRGSLALRAGQDNVHKVARRRHGLDLLEIVHHHGCWLSSVRVYKGRQVGRKEGRVGIYPVCVRRLLCRVCGGGQRGPGGGETSHRRQPQVPLQTKRLLFVMMPW